MRWSILKFDKQYNLILQNQQKLVIEIYDLRMAAYAKQSKVNRKSTQKREKTENDIASWITQSFMLVMFRLHK